MVTPEYVIDALDALNGDDPEKAHGEADTLLLALVRDDVRAAYQRAQVRCSWWASA